MATFFQHNPDAQTGADGLQTLVLMNPPTYVQYSGEPSVPTLAPALPGNNLIFLNSVSSMASLPQTSQHLVGIPLPTGPVARDSNTQSSMPPEMPPYHCLPSRLRCNPWNPSDPTRETASLESTTPRSQQGLSLSLSSRQQPPALSNYGARASSEREVAAPSKPQASILSREDVRVSSGGLLSAAPGVTIGISGMPTAVLSSKYLKAAQELLDEVVNVVHGIMLKEDTTKKGGDEEKTSGDQTTAVPKVGDGSTSREGLAAVGKSSPELTAVERQEVQVKKAKLRAMLDEVTSYMTVHILAIRDNKVIRLLLHIDRQKSALNKHI